MKSKFSPKYIIIDFFKFYRKDRIKILSIPFFIAIVLSFFVNINIDLINILLVSLSILIGFLLNLMLSSFNLKDAKVESKQWGIKKYNIRDFLLEYHITISFELLISINLVIILLIVSLINKNMFNYIPINYIHVFKVIFNFIVVYGLSLFFIVIFRVFKFGYILLKYYIEN